MVRNFLLAIALTGAVGTASALVPNIDIDSLPRLAEPPRETTRVVPTQVLRWRQEALALEHGDGMPRDELHAAELYCRAARHGDADSQFNLGWMYTNSRGIERNDAYAAHLFAAAAEQGMVQAQNMARTLGTPIGDPPPCLRSPDDDPPLVHAKGKRGAPVRTSGVAPPVPDNAPAAIVNFVRVVAPEYQLEPWLVLAIMATESNFNPWAVSPANARGLMQLIPDTAARFRVKNIMDPAQNIRGGMAYLRWLMAYFEGDVALVAAAYNAGEGAVERYRGVPPYTETRNYVRKILIRTGGRRSHEYDAKVAQPSRLAQTIRGAMR